MTPSKNPLIFLHGALGVASDAEPLMGLVRETGVNCYSFTFSGHGQLQNDPEEFRIDLFARDLDHFLDKNNLKNPSIFGHSMGGYVALYHKAHMENSSIKKIFTYGTKFNWSQTNVARELQMMNPDHLLEKFPLFVETLKAKHGSRWKHVLRSTAHMMQNLERLDGLTKEDMADIDVPVFLLLGDQDRMVSKEETLLTSSWLHHSLQKTISHSKHELERSNLREIADIICENLD